MRRLPACLGAALCLSSLLLSGCISAPDYGAMQAEGSARQVPLLIFDTSWNSPRGRWTNRHLGDSVPPGDFFVEFIATHSRDLASVSIYVDRCGAKGIESYGSWLVLPGTFAAGMNYKVVPVTEDMPLDALLPASQVNHLRITEVKVVDADGKVFDYTSDVGKVLTSNISNFCANNV